MRLTSLTALSVIDGCEFVGDSATVTLQAEISATGQGRYDIGIFVALDGGSALAGECRHDYLPPPLSAAPAPSDLTSGIGPYLDASTSFANPCGDLGAGSTALYDLGRNLGDVSDPATPAAELTLPCIDRDADGAVDVGAVVSWDNDPRNFCQDKLDAFPSFQTRCSTQIVDIAGLAVPTQSLEIEAVLDPPTAGGVFNLLLDGAQVAFADQSGASSGPLPVTPFPFVHDVAETAGDAQTNLNDYASSIDCVETVGRCTHDSSIQCVTNAGCSGLSACDLTPMSVANCTACTSLAVTAPVEQSALLCTATNTFVGPPACSNGIDDDGDGRIDSADFGCSAANDTSERSPLYVCDDGVDNDGDTFIDYPTDPGCAHARAKKENPHCNDGLDNDGDNQIDYPLDSYCTSASASNEAPPPPSPGGCGIGPELAALLPLLAWARRRRQARSDAL